jgi:hypothetical protein
LQEKLTTDKDKLRQQNEDALKQWKSGAKQKEDLTKFKTRLQDMKEGKEDSYTKELKARDRFGDPLKLIKSSLMRYEKVGGSGDDMMYRVLTTQSGRKFVLPRCKFPPTQNRLQIEPGSRWDGVDRSN